MLLNFLYQCKLFFSLLTKQACTNTQHAFGFAHGGHGSCKKVFSVWISWLCSWWSRRTSPVTAEPSGEIDAELKWRHASFWHGLFGYHLCGCVHPLRLSPSLSSYTFCWTDRRQVNKNDYIALLKESNLRKSYLLRFIKLKDLKVSEKYEMMSNKCRDHICNLMEPKLSLPDWISPSPRWNGSLGGFCSLLAGDRDVTELWTALTSLVLLVVLFLCVHSSVEESLRWLSRADVSWRHLSFKKKSLRKSKMKRMTVDLDS